MCLFVSQVYSWPMSYVAPVITMFILALPLPAMKLSGGIKFVVVFMGSLYASLLLLPMIVHYKAAGLLLVALALYHSFYFTAKGGSPVIGTLATVGIALVTAIGSVSIDGVLILIGGLLQGIVVGIVFVWIGFALLPDSKAATLNLPSVPKPVAEKPDLAFARSSAFRSLFIVLPIVIWFLLSGASASYAAVMIKVASMGQQASVDHTRGVARSLLASTVIGGIAAIIGWHVLRIVPSLALYTLLIALAGLLMGRRVFQGPGMHPKGATWSYAYLTMIIVLAPAVLDQQTGSSADAAFWSRLIMFGLASFYGVSVVFVYDHVLGFGTIAGSKNQDAVAEAK